MAKPKVIPAPSAAILTQSINACIANGERLLDDAVQLEFQEPPCTKLMLSMIAQEEFAKAFLLFLVHEQILPWTASLLRAMNDHACKQLVGIIIEYINPEWETLEDLRRIISEEYDLGELLPPKVASAINILRHEKMRRWESKNWFWVDDPVYEPTAKQVAEGKRDRIKQNALYVRLGNDGSVTSKPTEVTPDVANTEYERARTYRSFVATLLEWGKRESVAYEKVRGALKMMFWDDRGIWAESGVPQSDAN
jgi:AbiV family abortive infection protein